MAGRIPFRGGRGAGGRRDGSGGSGGCGAGSSGSGGRGRGANEHRSSTPGTSLRPTSTSTPTYRLHDIPETPESPEDSVGTSFPINFPLVRRSGSSSSTPNVTPTTTIAAEAIAAENLAARAAAAATAAAETAATAAAASAAAAAAAAAQAEEDEMVDDEEVIKKIFVRVVPGKKPRFEPSVAKRLGKISKSKVCKEGSNWTKVTKEMKDFYWDEFKKYFKWPRGLDGPIKDCWKKSAGRQYCHFINDRKKDSEKKEYIPAATWSRWTSDWNTPEALELSHKKRVARMGSNGKCSKHSGGSITASEHAKRFEIKHKRKANAIELFDLLHRRKGDKGFVDEKSASVHTAFKARKIELSRQLDESSTPDDDEIYLEIVGGKNKEGGVYGVGSQSSSIVNSGSCSSYEENPEIITSSAVQEIVQQFLTNYEEQHEERVGQRIGKEVESRMTPLQAMLLQVQDLLARFPPIPGAANPTRMLEDATSDGEEERGDNISGDD